MNLSELVSANCLFKPLYERNNLFCFLAEITKPQKPTLRQFMNLPCCLDQKLADKNRV